MTDFIEHEFWQGPEYESGIDGQRIAIVAYSHWRDDHEPDDPSFTKAVVSAVISGEYKIRLFDQIAKYFGEEPQTFWKKVVFFNFIPDAIGTADERYAEGTSGQIARGRKRFLKILDAVRPDKVLVFSMKAWSSLPGTIEEKDNGKSPPLSDRFPNFSKGTIELSGAIRLPIFGLQHPERANQQKMISAVRYIMKYTHYWMTVYERSKDRWSYHIASPNRDYGFIEVRSAAPHEEGPDPDIVMNFAREALREEELNNEDDIW